MQSQGVGRTLEGMLAELRAGGTIVKMNATHWDVSKLPLPTGTCLDSTDNVERKHPVSSTCC